MLMAGGDIVPDILRVRRTYTIMARLIAKSGLRAP